MILTFEYEIIGHRRVMGDLYVVFGKWTNAFGDEGGEIETGLGHILMAFCQHNYSFGMTAEVKFDEDFPIAGGALTIETTAGVDGNFIAFGTS